MTLFSLLQPPTDPADAAAGTSTTCSPPEAIQLYSSHVIDFVGGRVISLDSSAAGAAAAGGEGGSTAAGGGGDGTAVNQSRYYSVMSYQAVQTEHDDDQQQQKSGASNTNNNNSSKRHLKPDLGIWDARSGEYASIILKRVVVDRAVAAAAGGGASADGLEEKKEDGHAEGGTSGTKNEVKTVVCTVDLSNPSQVQPSLEQMRQVILKMYDENEVNTTNSKGKKYQGQTTSIKQLSTSPFGTTQIKEAVTVKGSTTTSSSETKIALILAVILPPLSSSLSSSSTSNPAQEYKERQAQSLVVYHLHKFALEVDCTLCFVAENVSGVGGERENKSSSSEEEKSSTTTTKTRMSIDELARVIRRVAMGLSPVEQSDLLESATTSEDEEKFTEDDDASALALGSSGNNNTSIHAPGTHDAELIHGAFLRNASCEGRWDASKDELVVALPPPSHHHTTPGAGSGEKDAISVSDEEWLSKLASSVGLSAIDTSAPPSSSGSEGGSSKALTPAEKVEKKKELMKKKAKSSKGSSAAGGEKDPNSFFASLLSK